MWLVTAVAVLLALWIGWSFGRLGDPDDLEIDPPNMPAPSVDMHILDLHPSGVVVADRGGNVVFRNGSAKRLAGTHVGVLIDAAIERHITLALGGEATDDGETLEMYGPPKMVVVVTSHRIESGCVVFVDDVSEARRIDQVRTDFVANISHELKTPVGALAVLAETLVDETDPSTIERIVNRMLGEADRASRTVDDLMELSRIELGADQLDGERIRLSSVVAAAVDRVTEMAARRSVTISRLQPVDSARTAADVVVNGDRRQLTSAIGNLVENAVKYSDEGGAVQIRVRRAEPWLEIMVADQGVGIPQRDLDRIFERFYRVDRARSRGTGGTGLGLSIVRHVANNHAGEVAVSSTEGEGSTFVFRLPTSIIQSGDELSGPTEGVA